MISPLYQALGPLGYRRAAPASSIYSLASHLWKLDEESDGSVSVPRLATIGGQNYTDNNTVASAAKGVGAPANLPANVANLVAASNEYFSCANILGADANFTVGGWASLSPTGDVQVLFTASASGAGNFYLHVGSSLQLFTRGYTDVVTSAAGGYDSAGWFQFLAWHDADANQIGIAINGGTPVTAATGGANAAGDGTRIGYRVDRPVNGKLSSYGVWPFIFTSDQRAAFWNGGAGAPLP